MSRRTPVQPITASDAEIARALEQAQLPPLLATLVHLTGDASLLADDLAPNPLLMNEPQGGWSAEQQARVRALALRVLARHRDAGSPIPPPPSRELLTQIMSFTTATPDMAAYVPLLEEELAIRGEDLRAPGWHRRELDAERPFRVAVIGAGMSGLLAAYRLGQVGLDCVVLEKNRDVGGTWWENTYPG